VGGIPENTSAKSWRFRFYLDDSQKLDEIQAWAEQWVANQDALLNEVCDRLIAALFFFRLGPMYDGVQVGEILCRLPPGLAERQNLVAAMVMDADSSLFVVEYNGRRSSRTRIDINDAQTLRSLGSTDELLLQVRLEDFPAHGKTPVHVTMRSLHTGSPADIPISGSPYVL
jgi:hypothetical protein